ncbi:MotA/TolQ/ExbB proton channel family protein [Fulvimarina endophytica]|uniref:MotA/TolQ/ExbB proton channel family protein n=1 Tax=Fulvimarina endophytica TaxID=2293836 RepID=A0A371X279_9HYPH|nr:MotA/TolQ/ExbB proton channel family protein [Fulvimarina endophytica]RFC63328.1 MotA/TolQ/ExbB proton channel family protein [Fulvimarina endophytica]
MFETLLSPLYDLYELGGAVTLILLFLSVISLATFLLKIWQFAAAGVGRRGTSKKAVDRFVDGQERDALTIAQGGCSPVAVVVAAAIRGILFRPDARADVEEDVQRIAQERLHRLTAGLRLLEAIAQIAPLLGLFGTVLGMIEAFQAMQGAGSNIDPSQLAGGIWVALLTTAVGLAVAMPTQLAVTWLDSRIENERVGMETALAAIFTRRITDRAPEAAARAKGPSVRKAEPSLVPGE